MGKTIIHGGMRLLAGAHALEPVGRMLERQVTLAHWRKLGFTGQKNVFGWPKLVDIRIVFVVPLLLDHGVTRASLSAIVEECRLFPHETRERRRIVAKAG